MNNEEWNLWKSVIICGQKKSDHRCFFYRPQINTDWHRLRAKGSDWDDYDSCCMVRKCVSVAKPICHKEISVFRPYHICQAYIIFSINVCNGYFCVLYLYFCHNSNSTYHKTYFCCKNTIFPGKMQENPQKFCIWRFICYITRLKNFLCYQIVFESIVPPNDVNKMFKE